MGAFIAQQPNGLYCRFSSFVDCPTHWNMTREDYLNNITGTVASREEGEDILNRFLVPFSEVKDRFTTLNMTRSEFKDLLKIMSEPVEGSKNDSMVQQYILFLNGESYGGGDLDYMRELIADHLILFKAHDMNEVDFKIVKNTGGLFERMTSMDMRLSVARGMVKLGELEPGSLFIFQDTIAVKSAYRINGACECTIIGDGSAFWGGAKGAEVNNLLVQPARLTPIK